jgi:hypothetical protein
MKRFICTILFATLAAGCGLDRITVTIEERTSVPGASLPEQLLGDLGFPGFADFDITESRTFQNEGYTANDIDKVFTRSFELRVVEPAGQTFDFLSSIRFTARAEGLPDLDFAWLDPIPEGASQLELEVDDDADLQSYVVAPEMSIDTVASGRRPSQATTIEARIAFDVEIKIF